MLATVSLVLTYCKPIELMHMRPAATEMKRDVFSDIGYHHQFAEVSLMAAYGSNHDHKNHVEQLLSMQLTAVRAAVRRNAPTAAKSSVSRGQQLLRVVLVNLF